MQKTPKGPRRVYIAKQGSDHVRAHEEGHGHSLRGQAVDVSVPNGQSMNELRSVLSLSPRHTYLSLDAQANYHRDPVYRVHHTTHTFRTKMSRH